MKNMKIEVLDLSVRSYNCLKKSGVNTIEEMAILDLSKIKGCGEKSKKEIKDKINYLIDEGFFSQKFINDYLNTSNIDKANYVDSLSLSNRSKNVLKSLLVNCADDLLSLNEDILYRVRNSGKSTVEEIMNFINLNNDQLFKEKLYSENFKISYNINIVSNFSGQTKINVFPISDKLIKELTDNDIITINDLLENKITVTEINSVEYKKNYEFFHNLAYGPLCLKISKELSSYSIRLPFDLKKYKRSDYINVKDLINYVLNNFNDLNFKEKINSKLFLQWLNSFENRNLEKEFITSLNLNIRQKQVLALRSHLTLEEIGKKLNLTRERIRQLESKTLKKIKEKYLYYPFLFIDLNKVYYSNKSSNKELFLLFLCENFDDCFIKIKEDNHYYYLPKKTYYELKNFIEENNDLLESQGFIFYKNLENNDILKKTISYMNLNFSNNFISKKLTKKAYVKYTMRYINRPISISNDNDIEEIIKTAEYLFGLKLEKTRGVEALITDAGVRVDSGTYSADDNIIPLDPDILFKIVEYVREKQIINTRDLFVEFGETLREHNLNNEVILYRYLKENLNDKLFFNGVSAVISSSNEITSWGDLAIKIINETKKPINKLDFIVKYAVTDAVYYNLAINFDDIIFWSNNELYLKSMINIKKDKLDNLTSYIKENQIVSFNNIKKFLLNNDPDFLKNNNILSNMNLYYFLINILNEGFVVDKNNEEVRALRKKKNIIEKHYSVAEELTL